MKSQEIFVHEIRFIQLNKQINFGENPVAFSKFDYIHHSDAEHMIVILWYARHVEKE